MIYFFSGTGNSREAAERLEAALGSEVRFIPHCNPYEESAGDATSIGFVFPVYAWGVPPIVLDFIARLPQKMVDEIVGRDIPVWAVAVCGDETGKAVEMLRKALARRRIALRGAWSLIMPNVYVLLPGFGIDSKELERKKLTDAGSRINEIAECIKSADWRFDVHEGSFPRLKTSLVYPLFKRMGVDTRRWHAEDSCIGCGKCAAVCPVGNISIPAAIADSHSGNAQSKPSWGTDCTSCCACFHVCPTNSVQYGSVTRGYAQYQPQRSENTGNEPKQL